MLWSWGLLLLFLSTSADALTVHYKSGDNFTMACSSDECIDNLDKISGVYLYRDDDKITYYDYNPTKDDKFTPQKTQDVSRIVKMGSFEKHSITIMNVTIRDSGLYHCSYYSFSNKCNVQCNWIKVVISEDFQSPTTHSPKEASLSENGSCFPPILIIVLTATVSILTTMIFTLIIIPKVKDCLREPGDARSHSNNVYEVMTRNGLRSVS